MPPPPRPAPLPAGFLLLGMLLGVVAFGTGALLAEDVPSPLGRILLAAVTAITLVVIEALWWMRPWVVRATDAWAVACTGAAIAGIVAGGGVLVYLVVVVALTFVGLPCAAVCWYVRSSARRVGLSP